MTVFCVDGVNRLVNLVDDRDLCLLHCVKYDSYLITAFIVQSAHFPNQVIFIRYRFYSSDGHCYTSSWFSVRNIDCLVAEHFSFYQLLSRHL